MRVIFTVIFLEETLKLLSLQNFLSLLVGLEIVLRIILLLPKESYPLSSRSVFTQALNKYKNFIAVTANSILKIYKWTSDCVKKKIIKKKG